MAYTKLTTKTGVKVAHSRLNCRVDTVIKERAERAAGVLGQSLTDFTEAALAEKSEAVLSELNRIRLSERDFEQFMAVLANPPAPTPALVVAAAEYRALREREPESGW